MKNVEEFIKISQEINRMQNAINTVIGILCKKLSIIKDDLPTIKYWEHDIEKKMEGDSLSIDCNFFTINIMTLMHRGRRIGFEFSSPQKKVHIFCKLDADWINLEDDIPPEYILMIFKNLQTIVDNIDKQFAKPQVKQYLDFFVEKHKNILEN